MGSKQTTTQEQSKDPWKPAMPALNNILDRTQQLASDNSNFTPIYGQQTQNSVNALGALGSSPSFGATTMQGAIGQTQQGLGAGLQGLMSTANGGYLQGNPYLDSVLGKSMQDTADKVNSQFSAAGRYGSGAQTAALTRELGGLETNARMGNYDAERARQQQAQGLLGQYGLTGAQMAPGVDAANAAQIGYGLTAGSLQDQMATAQKQAANGMTANQYQAGMTIPIAGLGGQSSGTAMQASPMNVGGMIGGAAMTGLGLMSGNPMMAMGGMGTMGKGFGGV